VSPEFRRRGLAPELIRRVLDDVRAQGKAVTVMVQIVRTSIENTFEYARTRRSRASRSNQRLPMALAAPGPLVAGGRRRGTSENMTLSVILRD
jgi:hypothetical protein